MKKLILILTLFVTFNSVQSQDRRDKIKEFKIAFITERLNLSSEEAQTFWPIYNAHEAKIEGIRKNDLREVREAMRRGNLSESEAKQVLNQFMSVQDKLHQANKQLVKDLDNVIPPQKIIALKAAEEEFKRVLVGKLKERRERRN